MTNKVKRRATTAVGMLSLAILPIAITSASVSASTARTLSETRVPLHFVNVSSISPLPSGLSRITLDNGVVLIVPTSVAAKIRLRDVRNSVSSPLNTAYGNCGYSYIYVEPDSNNSGVYGWTGFEVYASVIGEAYFYQWGALIQNITYDKQSTWINWIDPTSSNSWIIGFYDVQGTGSYTAYVVGEYPSFTAYVFGTNGVCSSAGARSYTTVY